MHKKERGKRAKESMKESVKKRESAKKVKREKSAKEKSERKIKHERQRKNERKGKRKFKSVKDRNNTQKSKWERRSKSVKEKKVCRKETKEKKSLCNKEMDTWVSSGWQRHVTHYRQRLEKSLVFLLQSHHMKTNTALVRHRTARHELRSTNTWGRNSRGSQSGTGKRDISASAIPRERCSQHRHMFASCFTELTERAAAKGWKGLQHTSCCCIRDRKTHSGRLTGLLRFKCV